jgi:hypothetical protein
MYYFLFYFNIFIYILMLGYRRWEHTLSFIASIYYADLCITLFTNISEFYIY